MNFIYIYTMLSEILGVVFKAKRKKPKYQIIKIVL